MRRARLAALLGVAIALAWPLAPTPAYASGLSVGIDNLGGGTSPSITVAGNVIVTDFLAEVHDVQVEVRRGATFIDGGSACTGCPSGSSASYSFTTSVSRNGTYTVSVSASGPGLGYAVSGGDSREVAVAVAPASPTNLSATVLGDRRVSLSWTGVSHPDLRGYAIYRKLGTGGFTLLDGTLPGSTSYTDGTATAGPVQYYVTTLRDGAVASNDPNQWLESAPSLTAPASVPVPPAPVEPTSDTTTTLPPGTPQPADVSSPGLTDIFSASPATIPPPQISPTPTLPDGGFSPSLPFSATSEPARVGGRAPGRPAAASASGDLSAGNSPGSSTNRRALLVPVAAGSVLCVAALHLRWLNRRLGGFPVGGTGGGLGADLEPTDFDPASLPDVPDADRLPVGAGR